MFDGNRRNAKLNVCKSKVNDTVRNERRKQQNKSKKNTNHIFKALKLFLHIVHCINNPGTVLQVLIAHDKDKEYNSLTYVSKENLENNALMNYKMGVMITRTTQSHVLCTFTCRLIDIPLLVLLSSPLSTAVGY